MLVLVPVFLLVVLGVSGGAIADRLVTGLGGAVWSSGQAIQPQANVDEQVTVGSDGASGEAVVVVAALSSSTGIALWTSVARRLGRAVACTGRAPQSALRARVPVILRSAILPHASVDHVRLAATVVANAGSRCRRNSTPSGHFGHRRQLRFHKSCLLYICCDKQTARLPTTLATFTSKI